MIKRIKQLLFLVIAFLLFSPQVSAASLSIWANASNVTVGKTVTISVNAKDMGGSFNITSSNASVLSGGGSGKWLENDTYTFQFTAKKVGKATITVTPVDVATNDTEPVPYTTSKSVTLNVVAKPSSSSNNSGGITNSGGNGGTTADKKEYSSDNTLKSLSIEGYKLSPEFKKDVVEYKLAVDESVEKIKVVAKANHDKASVSGAGEVSLSSGENTIEIKVTAENGNEKKYKIVVTVEDQNPIVVRVGKEDFTVVKKNNKLIDKLEYYEETTIKINEKDVVAYVNAKTKVTLVILKNKDNKINYYIYDEKKNTYQEYNTITINGVTLQLVSPVGKLNNYKKYILDLENKKIAYFKLKESSKNGLIYGINVKTGNAGYYFYDQAEETLSRYFDDEVEIYEEEVKKLKNYLMIFMGSVSFVAILLIVISLYRSKKNKNKRKYL